MNEEIPQQTLEEFQDEVRELWKKMDPRFVTQGKTPAPQGFWDVQEQERRIREDLDNKIRNLSSAIALADRVIAVQGQPGWQEFVKALEDMRIYRRQELELCGGADSELRILQGRCRELGAMLSLVKRATKNREALAEQLKSLQDERAAIVRPDGKLQPQQG